MKKLSRIGAIGASLALLGALSIPGAASAADGDGKAVVLKGHITTHDGEPIKGAVVEVIADFGDLHFNKGDRTSSTGRYAITVKPNATYRINFIGQSSDDYRIDPEYLSKTGHVRVGSKDLRLNKSLKLDK